MELSQPPHLPLMQRSGAQSSSDVQSKLHLPVLAPLQACEPPQLSLVAHWQTPPVQMPLWQSAFEVHMKVLHEPPHTPSPQSAFAVQASWLQVALLHLPPVAPQAALEPQVGGGVQVAEAQVPSGHSPSLLQLDLLHLAPLHSALMPQLASPAQALVLHLEPVHTPLDGQEASPAQTADVLHLEPVHKPLDGQAASPAQAADVLHLEPVHKPLDGQDASPAHAADVLHLEPVHKPLEGQAASPAQPAGLPHLAPVHEPLAGQPMSPAHVNAVLHLAFAQTPPEVPHSESPAH